MADAIDKVKNIAFWQWEYTRRNPKYRRYSEALSALDDRLVSHGVFDLFKNTDYQKEAKEYSAAKEIFSYYHLTDGQLSEDSMKELRRWRMLKDKFTERFMRRRKSFLQGGFTCYEMILGMISEGRNYEYDTDVFKWNDDYSLDSLDDILALLLYHHEWSILVDEKMPPKVDFEMLIGFSYRPTKTAIDSIHTGDEVRSLAYLHDFLNCEERVPDELCRIVYRLSIAGKKINPADEMRKFLLILWDDLNRSGRFDREAFDLYYSDVLRMIEEEGATHSIWKQVASNKTRIYKYFQATCRCIEDMHVYSLNAF